MENRDYSHDYTYASRLVLSKEESGAVCGEHGHIICGQHDDFFMLMAAHDEIVETALQF